MRYLISGALVLVFAAGCSAPTAPSAPIVPSSVELAKDWICPAENGFVIRTGWEPGCEPYGGGE